MRNKLYLEIKKKLPGRVCFIQLLWVQQTPSTYPVLEAVDYKRFESLQNHLDWEIFLFFPLLSVKIIYFECLTDNDFSLGTVTGWHQVGNTFELLLRGAVLLWMALSCWLASGEHQVELKSILVF